MEYLANNLCYAKDYCKQYSTAKCNSLCDFKLVLDALYNLSDIPKRYRHDLPLRPEQIDLQVFHYLKEYREDINVHVDRGDWLYLYSTVSGNGKTTWSTKFASAYFRHLLRTGNFDIENKVLYLNTNIFLEQLRDSFDNDSSNIKMILDRAYKCDLLLLDDIGVERGTAWTQERLYDLLNTRYNDCKATVFTSNLSPTEIEDKLGKRIASRIRSSKVLELKGADRRG